ncbi:MAG: 3-ketoacyl-ACP reductase [Syntrophus sp. RIFOXYC2_FULL_54_9]|nr:MAG: 3-ketoacyl-ACP reductase [Syntrophus sp. RIFOXYC2_FULL_54_9]
MTNEKVALITGAARGIGRAIAVALAKERWHIVVNYRANEDAAREALKLVEGAGGSGIVVRADIADAADRDRLVAEALEAFARIDLLVNNAAMGPRRRVDLLDMTENSYDELMATNLKGPFFLTQLVARRMIELKTENARIINIGSISAYTCSTSRGEYCLSKAGMGMMTALFAHRLAECGINVYEVRPGFIRTDLTSPVWDKYDRMIAEGLTTIARWGEPEEVARAVVAIAQGCFPISTEEVINVDSGFHLRRL